MSKCSSLAQRGCADATFTMKLALQTVHEHNQEAYLVFVDLVKAYDTVNRELLFKILESYGIPPNLITILKKLYTDVMIHLKVGSKTETFGSTCGVKQGDNLAPILFIIFMNAVSTMLDELWKNAFKKPGFKWAPDTAMHGQTQWMTHRNQVRNQRKTFFLLEILLC